MSIAGAWGETAVTSGELTVWPAGQPIEALPGEATVPIPRQFVEG